MSPVEDPITRAYKVWTLHTGELLPAADYMLATNSRGRYQRSALRYQASYLTHPQAVALHPKHCPLQPITYEWDEPFTPAFLDDILPGLWERRVLARWRHQQGDTRDPDHLHALLESPREWPPGAITITPAEHTPQPPQAGHDLEHLNTLLSTVKTIEQHQTPDLSGLQQLHQGSSLGGARPKVAVFDTADNSAWIAKFSASQDNFNYVRVEHACLQLAQACGLQTVESKITTINHQDVLLVKRFDMHRSPTKTPQRLPLHSANSFLKDTNQQDIAFSSYNDLTQLIRQYSHNVSHDLQQIAGQMLFNNCIHNRDDHLRNFSFLGTGTNLALSPAYDLVPSDTLGTYPQLNFNNQPRLAKLSDLNAISQAFQLTPKETRTVTNNIKAGMQTWQEQFTDAGVNQTDMQLMQQLINIR